MKTILKHEASRVSTWGIAALAILADQGPQIASILPLPPHAALILGVAVAVVKAVTQGAKP